MQHGPGVPFRCLHGIAWHIFWLGCHTWHYWGVTTLLDQRYQTNKIIAGGFFSPDDCYSTRSPIRFPIYPRPTTNFAEDRRRSPWAPFTFVSPSWTTTLLPRNRPFTPSSPWTPALFILRSEYPPLSTAPSPAPSTPLTFSKHQAF